jgi:signal transduction histidine kinase
MMRTLRGRLVVAIVLGLIFEGLFVTCLQFFERNQIRLDLQRVLFQTLDDAGGLEACDADPTAWVLADHGWGTAWPVDASGRPIGPGAPDMVIPDTAPGEVVSLEDNWPTPMLSVIDTGRDKPCRRFVFVQDAMPVVMLAVVRDMAIAKAFMSVLISLGVVGLVMREPVKRLERLAKFARGWAAGDVTERLPDETHDEIGDVGNALAAAARAARERMEALQSRDQMLRHLLADVAHDARHPLGTLRLVLDRPLSNERRIGALADVAHLQGLLDQLDAFARLEGSSLPLATRAFPVAGLLSRLQARFGPDAAARGLTCVIDGEPAPEASAFGDELLLESAVGNLVRNAIEVARTTVTLAARRRDHGWVFEVTDDGPGLDPDTATRVIAREARGEHKRPEPGRGLGLAIAESVARRHGGAFRFSASESGGMCAEIEIAAEDDPPHGLT